MKICLCTGVVNIWNWQLLEADGITKGSDKLMDTGISVHHAGLWSSAPAEPLLVWAQHEDTHAEDVNTRPKGPVSSHCG